MAPESPLKPVYILAFSGHRKIGDPEGLRIRIRRALIRYQQSTEALGGELHLHCSMAYGSDLLAVEEAEDLGIPVHLILPRELAPEPVGNAAPQGMAADFVDDETGAFRTADWTRARRAIENARKGRNSGTLRFVTPEPPAPECYYDAGIRMLTAADGLLIVWNGQQARGLGGTADIYDHARMMDIPVGIISLDDSADTEVEAYLNDTGGRLTRELLEGASADITGIFDQLDRRAAAIGSSFRSRITASIRLHFYATLIAALSASLATAPWAKSLLLAFAALEGLLVSIAWRLQSKGADSHAKVAWLDLRFAAEIVRSLSATNDLCDPMYPIVQKHRADWARFARTIALNLHRRCRQPDISWVDHRATYVRERIEGQTAYFESKQRAADAESRRLSRFGTFAADAAPWVVIGALVFKLCEKYGVLGAAGSETLAASALRFLPIALPLIAGHIGSLRQAGDSERRRIRYAELAAQLKLLGRSIVHLRSESSVIHTVIQAEEVLLSEQLEWRLRESQAAHH